MGARCVVLAAGRSLRMGSPKLLLPYGAGTVLDAVLSACRGLPTTIVASSGLAETLRRDDVSIVINDEPERGMTHSLRLANRAISAEHTLAVLLGDKPLVTEQLVIRVLAALGARTDIAFPIRGGVPGHPVVLAPRARALLDELRDGDTLHLLRDDVRLTRARVEVDEEGPYVDIDTEADYRRLLYESAATMVSVS